jgi:hypothetical protein
MEEIPSLLNTGAVIAKAVSEFAKIGIYPLNPDVFREEDFHFRRSAQCRVCDYVQEIELG